MSLQKKNNTEALKLRNSGNEYFQKKEFFEAILKYNHSLCFAEPGTDHVSLAYGNRSAAYIELNQFDMCLKDIQLAIKYDYPSDKMDKLKKREETCVNTMKTCKPNPDNDPFNFFKLSHPENKKYSGIVDCLELSNNKKFGNHVITTKPLKTGDIIGIEEPTFTAANADARLYRCSNCFKDSSLHLLPCIGCTMAMFCSEKCQQTSMNEFHQFECNVPNNPKMKLDLILRLLVKCLNIFDYNVLEFQKFVDQNKKTFTIFDFDFSNPDDPMYAKNMMLVMLSTQNNAAYCKVIMDALGSEMKEFINCHSKLKELWKHHSRFLNEMLAKLIYPVSFLSHMSVFFTKAVNLPTETYLGKFQERTKPKPNRKNLYEENAGQGFYPALCLLNGSCDPNMHVVSVGNKLAWIVSKPIPAGSQIFRKDVEPFYNCGPASYRQDFVNKSYGYKCCCAACQFDWPRFSGLKAIDPNFEYSKIQTISSPEIAKENIRKNVEYIEKHYKHNRPSKEVYMCIDYNLYEFSSLAKPAWY